MFHWKIVAARFSHARLPAAILALAIVTSTLIGAQARPAAAQTDSEVFLPLVSTNGAPTAAQTSVQLIDAAEADGELNTETALLFRVYALFGDSRLPAKYLGSGDQLDTLIMQRVAQQYASLSPATQGLLAPFFQPPIYEDSWYAAQQPTRSAEASTAADECAFTPGPTPIPSDGWECLDGTTANIRVWWEANSPSQRITARRIYDALQADIWPKLTILMRRDPPSDKGPHPFVDLNGEQQVWGDGGDGRLDIYLVQPPPRTGGAATLAYPPGCDLRPSFMLVSPTLDDDTLLPAITHELFHTFQFGTDQKKNCDEYEWWSEATANWAIDFVYPEDNWEHRWAYTYMQTRDWRDSIRTLLVGGRSAYLLPLFLTKTLNDPGLIRRSWANAATFSNDSYAAVDQAINGQLTDLWHDFALAVANQEPFDSFKDWDEITLKVEGDPTPDKEPVRESLSHFPTKGEITNLYTDARLGGAQDDKFTLPTEIDPLAMRFYHFKFQGTDTRSVAFSHSFLGSVPEGGKIQALIKIAGEEWRVEDWTGSVTTTFCRDIRDERIEELLIVISNGQWHNREQKLTLNPDPWLAVTNIGCFRWVGTFETDVTHNNGVDNYTHHYEGTLAFEPRTDIQGNMIRQYYELVDASVTWTLSGTLSGDCTLSGATTLSDFAPNEGNLETSSFLADSQLEDYRVHSGTVSYDYGGIATTTCPSGVFTGDQFHGVIADFGDGTKPITANGLLLQGRHSESDSVGNSKVTTWKLEAKPEP